MRCWCDHRCYFESHFALENALAVVRTRCESKESCAFVSRPEEFGDPCPKTDKYLNVTYSCLGIMETPCDQICEGSDIPMMSSFTFCAKRLPVLNTPRGWARLAAVTLATLVKLLGLAPVTSHPNSLVHVQVSQPNDVFFVASLVEKRHLAHQMPLDRDPHALAPKDICLHLIGDLLEVHGKELASVITDFVTCCPETRILDTPCPSRSSGWPDCECDDGFISETAITWEGGLGGKGFHPVCSGSAISHSLLSFKTDPIRKNVSKQCRDTRCLPMH